MKYLNSSAVISPCGKYRTTLKRIWNFPCNPIGFIMLNPSTADGEVDDPTIRKCVYYAEREGAGGIIVENLYSYRATNPKDLWLARRAGVDIVGEENTEILTKLFRYTSKVVLAWGAIPEREMRPDQLRRVIAYFRTCGPVHHLARTKAGHPGHPLYLRNDAPLMPWEETT